MAIDKVLWARYLTYKGLKEKEFGIDDQGRVHLKKQAADKDENKDGLNDTPVDSVDLSDGLKKEEAQALGLKWKQIDHQTAQGWKRDGADGVQTGSDASIIMPEEILAMEGNVERYAHDFGISKDEAEKLFFTFKLIPVGELRGTYAKLEKAKTELTNQFESYKSQADNAGKTYIEYLQSLGVPQGSYLMKNDVKDVETHLRLAFISTIPFPDKQQEIFNLKAPTDNPCDDPYNVDKLLAWSKAAMPVAVQAPVPAPEAAPAPSAVEVPAAQVATQPPAPVVQAAPASMASTMAQHAPVVQEAPEAAQAPVAAALVAPAESVKVDDSEQKIQESITQIITKLHNNNIVIIKRPNLQYKFYLAGGNLEYFTSNLSDVNVEEKWTQGVVDLRDINAILNDKINAFSSNQDVLRLLASNIKEYSTVTNNIITFKTDGRQASIEIEAIASVLQAETSPAPAPAPASAAPTSFADDPDAIHVDENNEEDAPEEEQTSPTSAAPAPIPAPAPEPSPALAHLPAAEAPAQATEPIRYDVTKLNNYAKVKPLSDKLLAFLEKEGAIVTIKEETIIRPSNERRDISFIFERKAGKLLISGTDIQGGPVDYNDINNDQPDEYRIIFIIGGQLNVPDKATQLLKKLQTANLQGANKIILDVTKESSAIQVSGPVAPRQSSGPEKAILSAFDAGVKEIVFQTKQYKYRMYLPREGKPVQIEYSSDDKTWSGGKFKPEDNTNEKLLRTALPTISSAYANIQEALEGITGVIKDKKIVLTITSDGKVTAKTEEITQAELQTLQPQSQPNVSAPEAQAPAPKPGKPIPRATPLAAPAAAQAPAPASAPLLASNFAVEAKLIKLLKEGSVKQIEFYNSDSSSLVEKVEIVANDSRELVFVEKTYVNPQGSLVSFPSLCSSDVAKIDYILPVFFDLVQHEENYSKILPTLEKLNFDGKADKKLVLSLNNGDIVAMFTEIEPEKAKQPASTPAPATAPAPVAGTAPATPAPAPVNNRPKLGRLLAEAKSNIQAGKWEDAAGNVQNMLEIDSYDVDARVLQGLLDTAHVAVYKKAEEGQVDDQYLSELKDAIANKGEKEKQQAIFKVAAETIVRMFESLDVNVQNNRIEQYSGSMTEAFQLLEILPAPVKQERLDLFSAIAITKDAISFINDRKKLSAEDNLLAKSLLIDLKGDFASPIGEIGGSSPMKFSNEKLAEMSAKVALLKEGFQSYLGKVKAKIKAGKYVEARTALALLPDNIKEGGTGNDNLEEANILLDRLAVVLEDADGKIEIKREFYPTGFISSKINDINDRSINSQDFELYLRSQLAREYFYRARQHASNLQEMIARIKKAIDILAIEKFRADHEDLNSAVGIATEAIALPVNTRGLANYLSTLATVFSPRLNNIELSERITTEKLQELQTGFEQLKVSSPVPRKMTAAEIVARQTASPAQPARVQALPPPLSAGIESAVAALGGMQVTEPEKKDKVEKTEEPAKPKVEYVTSQEVEEIAKQMEATKQENLITLAGQLRLLFSQNGRMKKETLKTFSDGLDEFYGRKPAGSTSTGNAKKTKIPDPAAAAPAERQIVTIKKADGSEGWKFQLPQLVNQDNPQPGLDQLSAILADLGKKDNVNTDLLPAFSTKLIFEPTRNEVSTALAKLREIADGSRPLTPVEKEVLSELFDCSVSALENLGAKEPDASTPKKIHDCVDWAREVLAANETGKTDVTKALKMLKALELNIFHQGYLGDHSGSAIAKQIEALRSKMPQPKTKGYETWQALRDKLSKIESQSLITNLTDASQSVAKIEGRNSFKQSSLAVKLKEIADKIAKLGIKGAISRWDNSGSDIDDVNAVVIEMEGIDEKFTNLQSEGLKLLNEAKLLIKIDEAKAAIDEAGALAPQVVNKKEQEAVFEEKRKLSVLLDSGSAAYEAVSAALLSLNNAMLGTSGIRIPDKTDDFVKSIGKLVGRKAKLEYERYIKRDPSFKTKILYSVSIVAPQTRGNSSITVKIKFTSSNESDRSFVGSLNDPEMIFSYSTIGFPSDALFKMIDETSRKMQNTALVFTPSGS